MTPEEVAKALLNAEENAPQFGDILPPGEAVTIRVAGVQGDKGEPGDNGKDGERGPQGEKGEPGDDGRDGERGLQGDKGDKGERGEPGQDGVSVREAQAETLEADRPATAQFDPITGLLRLGIPRGPKGDTGGGGGRLPSTRDFPSRLFGGGGGGGISESQLTTAVSDHSSDTTDVHGISDTSVLLTESDTLDLFVGPPLLYWADRTLAMLGANDLTVMAFIVNRAVTVTQGHVYIGTSSGNIDIGILDDSYNRLGSSGSTAMGSTGLQTIPLTDPLDLVPGEKYYAAVAIDNTTAAIGAYFNSTVFSLQVAAGLVGRATSSFPIPATNSPASASSRMMAVYFT